MARFPGKTLEELDQVDVLRLLRAYRVQRIDDRLRRVEEIRRMSRDRDAQERLRPHDWEELDRFDAMLRRWGIERPAGSEDDSELDDGE